ncbi:hypothetical protein FACS1894200_08710 [Spirochaetia bacterium]|nr:hypothetical protein FACS1894200_08710 [Spirochaetia bacterium]
MKTVEDYLNDPRITEDPDMQDVPFCIKKIHAVRLKIQDETKDMTFEEEKVYYHEGTKAAFAEFGITPKYAVQ